ncbi:MAG: 7-carboxy-7-deazaguanine synthase QueE [Acidobacteriia bacterium]|nr:7-carboxy-7-deazaguanine synthase QueE [Terriglobia bacterium]
MPFIKEEFSEGEPQTSLPPADADLRISEVFESVQGEGVNIGTPSIFLRLALCNLRCSWCDTKYTWDWEQYKFEDEVRVISQKDLLRLMRERRSRNVVITGGEPLLQQRQLVAVLRNLAPEYTFEVETAGTIVPSDDMVELIKTWNVSPKLANSGNPLQARHRTLPLTRFAQLENAFFKFVIQAENDIHEVLDLVNEFHIPAARVLLMPEATDPAVLDKKSDWLAQLCIQHQFRLGYRLHVALWGNKRGV